MVELDRDGNVLRVVTSTEDHDFEVIKYPGRNLYVLPHESALVLVSDLTSVKKVMLLRGGFCGFQSNIPQTVVFLQMTDTHCG